MYNHTPQGYNCPICLGINGIESPETMIMQNDIFYRDELVMALLNSKFVGNNPGHAIVVPIKHYENLYDLPEEVGNRIMKIAKQVALAIKHTRECEGIMIQQNNEPASGQHAFHYHMHVFPRFTDDKLWENQSNARVSNPEERKQYSAALKKYFNKIEQI